MLIRQSVCFVFLVIGVYPTTAKPTDGACFDCIHYNFEMGLQSFFSNIGICRGLNTWTEGTYSTIDIELPNEFTQSFISPQVNISCTTSFPFTMAAGGSVYINVYIDSVDANYEDLVLVLAEEIVANGQNPTVGVVTRYSKDPNFVNGWQTLVLPIQSSTTFEGQLTFMGQTQENSKVLVDSFCYKPANYNGDCWVDYVVVPETETTTVVMEPDSEEASTTVVIEPDSEEPSTTVVIEPDSEETPSTEVTSTTALPTDIVPDPTLPSPAPESNKCPLDPFIHTLLPHEYDCTLFYYCVWGEKVLRNCAAGLHFNPTIQVCDWPWSAGCTTQ